MEKEPEIPYGLKCLGILLALFFGVILAVMQPMVFGLIAFALICLFLEIDEQKLFLGACITIAILSILFIIIFSAVGLYNTTLDFFNYVAMNIK